MIWKQLLTWPRWFNSAILANALRESQVLLLVLLLGSTVLLGVANMNTQALDMHGRVIRQQGEPNFYHRRLDLAEQLIRETGRDDWALQMGMIRPENRKEASKTTTQEPLIM